MNEDRGRSPRTDDATSRSLAGRLGGVGLALSICGLLGLIAGPWLSSILGQGSPALIVFVVLSLAACAIGLIVGLVGTFFPPRRLAIWAALIGFFGSMQIPTFVTMFMLHK